MKQLNDLLAEKNEMITKGQILEAIEKFFVADARTLTLQVARVMERKG